MKKTFLIIVSMLLVTLLTVGCSTKNPDNSNNNNNNNNNNNQDELREFTLEELAQYNGKDGNPAYVAVNGKVYDVTDVPAWRGGSHQGSVTAGIDATEFISKSPHGTSVLNGLKIVGTLK
jgi:predicted heme/steroid binding protein